MTTTNREDELEGPQGSDEPDRTHDGRAAHRDENGVVVRGAVGDDLGGVLSVGHRTWLATYEPIAGPEYVAMGLAKWWTSDVVTDSIRKGRTLVAVKDDEVVGVATFGTQNDAFVMWKLYVLPDYHGHGIGSRLMDAVVDRAREAEHDRIILSYMEGNQLAARFYRRHGFVETHRESGGSGMPESVWMARELGEEETA
ncbi:GNAT family N-acetyltransferase [Terrabacter sp. MAHUQ-38]|uniref:GNAT family N-acetyltransferase n=1 Tax=unclassified Terrabacter TaxID=2630222 RepID=UPI00165E6155|nr:GNAT family N-acetyltransferase [Terrabacter sp. MAHUQ-38]MBC9821401.1 GNAT family N-acetyltransferase [Terrabacter sp. MAHUQ-38]